MFFDIGANIGKWSLANIDKYNKIISIEGIASIEIILLINIIK
jgi:hypothetical protein